jgi:hypothetical protein
VFWCFAEWDCCASCLPVMTEDMITKCSLHIEECLTLNVTPYLDSCLIGFYAIMNCIIHL